ncbi:MAG: ATP-binding cassette domain-containing protein [Treponema sp.]|jgi:oligopeptide/dipeptide ABC transporter ATP-binding protein|nr:ATP-binding cassette domain-containing protein [Treponema sp.]
MSQALIEVKNLVKRFDIHHSLRPATHIYAVNDVSFSIYQGETFGLVGESGCGKSTLGRAIMRIHDATSGVIRFAGVDITHLSGKALSPYRQRMQMIFQDPYSSLNPAMRVRDIVAEPLLLKTKPSAAECDERVSAMLSQVGLSASDMEKYPHEFSGGQRQRVSIARALIVRPSFVLCDEPISALDVSIQAQIVNLLEDLQAEFGLSYLFVAHDLSMVRHISRRIAVMYMGEIVEISSAREIYQNPLHPYTQVLLSSIPIPDPKRARAAQWNLVQGEVALPEASVVSAQACSFYPRCPRATEQCRAGRPMLRAAGEKHEVACFAIT